MFVITEYEQKQALDHSDDLAALFTENEAGPLYYKIFSNFMRKTTPMKEMQFNEKTLKKEIMQANFKKMINTMIFIASEAQDQIVYTTGQLSKYFGVSITSINKWIEEGRFIGISKGLKNQHTKIAENTLWISTSGKTVPVKDIVALWEEENIKRIQLASTYEEELEAEIKWFEEKFGGPLENTLKQKQNKTPEEETCQEQWEYLLQRRERGGE